MRRNWLRPKWYVVDLGNGMRVGSAHHDTMRRVPNDEVDPACVHCGKICENGGFDLTSGFECFGCNELLHPRVEPTAVQRAWRCIAWPIAEKWDALYWRYCQRFGERRNL